MTKAMLGHAPFVLFQAFSWSFRALFPCHSERSEESRAWMLRLVRQAVEVSPFNLSKRLNEL